jgi:hypothetical protein
MLASSNQRPRWLDWLLGDRTAAHDFITDIAGRLKSRIQLTSDGLHLYVNAVEQAFGADVDYAMLVKMYTNDRTGPALMERAAGTCARSSC